MKPFLGQLYSTCRFISLQTCLPSPERSDKNGLLLLAWHFMKILAVLLCVGREVVLWEWTRGYSGALPGSRHWICISEPRHHSKYISIPSSGNKIILNFPLGFFKVFFLVLLLIWIFRNIHQLCCHKLVLPPTWPGQSLRGTKLWKQQEFGIPALKSSRNGEFPLWKAAEWGVTTLSRSRSGELLQPPWAWAAADLCFQPPLLH